MPQYLDSGQRFIPDGTLVVSMVETLHRRLKMDDYKEFIQTFDLIIIDEAHKNTFNKLFEHLSEKTYVIGATATPLRTGKMKALKEYYDGIVNEITISELIELGFLAKPRYFGVPVDVSKVRTVRGDYDASQLSKIYDNRELYHGVVSNYENLAKGKKTIIFCSSIKNSQALVDEFKNAGYNNVRHLDSNCTDAYRDETLSWFENTPDAILSNVDILTTGFDCPSIECVILYRATKSLILYLQMVGRGGRVIPDVKESFIVLDFGENVKEHDYWHIDRTWSLDKEVKKNKKKGATAVKECPECGALVPVSAMKCNECGYIYPAKKKSKIEVVLEEKTEVLQKAKYKEANLSNMSMDELEAYRILKNYSLGWIQKMFRNADDFHEYSKLRGFKSNWAYMAIRKNLRK